MASSIDDGSSAWWLQLLIGPAAAAAAPTLNVEHPPSSSFNSSSSWWRTVALIVLAVEMAGGGWHAILERMEGFVVPFYTLLVFVYLVILVVSGPLEYLYRRFKSSNDGAALEEEEPELLEEENDAAVKVEQPFDISGSYKLMENDGFENFLAVQGVPWALRRAANQARPLHKLTHKGNRLTIQIKGLIESQTTYYINGPPVETNVRGRIFQDSVTYITDETDPDVRGIQVSKTAITEDYDITVRRRLSPDGKIIMVTSRAVFRDGRESVECIQKYERIPEQ